MGRITTLSRFIVCSAYRSFDFFKILRIIDRFQWNEYYEKAFQELEEYLGGLPILSKPWAKEKLWIYLATFEVSVSTVLIRQEKGEQYFVYCISYLFKRVELHYMPWD